MVWIIMVCGFYVTHSPKLTYLYDKVVIGIVLDAGDY